MRVRRFLGAIGLLAGVSLGCNGNDKPEVTHSPDGSSGGGGFGGSGAQDGGGGDDAGPTDASEEFVLPEASSIVVRVGIVPVAGPAGDAALGPADETLAHIDVLAAGSRAVTVVRRWDALFQDASTPNTQAWQYLGGISKIYSDAGRSLLLSLALVDRVDDARPAAVAGEWDAPGTINAVHALIDRTFATFGDELAYLSFGNEVDRYLAKATPSERSAYVALVENALAYARNHPSLPASLRLGVTLSADGAVQGGTEIDQLVAASDVAIVSYHALDPSFAARPASSAPGDLDALWTALGGDAGKSEIVLQEVAYPSGTDTSSSLEQQRTFFDGLFLALLSRRERFPFVVVRGLHEQRPEACEADALALGVPGDPVAIGAYCSYGLKSDAGENKPAWLSVVDGLATFSSP